LNPPSNFMPPPALGAVDHLLASIRRSTTRLFCITWESACPPTPAVWWAGGVSILHPSLPSPNSGKPLLPFALERKDLFVTSSDQFVDDGFSIAKKNLTFCIYGNQRGCIILRAQTLQIRLIWEDIHRCSSFSMTLFYAMGKACYLRIGTGNSWQ
jgi:hypothetical protein